jgi:hypothetical protein
MPRGKVAHAVDTLIREMPLRDGGARVHDNFRVGDKIGNAHVDFQKDLPA